MKDTYKIILNYNKLWKFHGSKLFIMQYSANA